MVLLSVKGKGKGKFGVEDDHFNLNMNVKYLRDVKILSR